MKKSHKTKSELNQSDYDIQKYNQEIEENRSSIDKKYADIAFYVVAAVIFAALFFTATRVGITGDEFLDQRNGEFALKYYADHDTTFVDYTQDEVLKSFPHMKYYGSGFEIIPAVMVRYFHLPESHLYSFRHFLCAFFGFLLILFTGLTAKRLTKSTVGGVTALLIMSCTPLIFGLSFFATKDIPFAAGFAIACYAFVSIFQNLPNFKIGHILLAVYGIALAVSIRIGGLMLALYLVLYFLLVIIFNNDKRQLLFKKPYNLLLKSLGIGTLIVFSGALIGLCFYPNFFYEGPVEHIKNALTVVSKFPQRIPMTFEGKQIDSLNLPDNYLLKSFLYTIPLFVFGFIMLFFINIVKIWKKYDRAAIVFLIFSVIFPISVVLLMNSNVYNGWRHETFTYYGAAVTASIGVYEFLNWFFGKKFFKIWRWAAPAIIFVFMLPTIVWMLKNYKYTYSYYNVLAGDPYLHFDLDYFETSQTILLDYLVNNELKDNHDSIVVSSKNNNAVYYQNVKQYPNLTVNKASYKDFAQTSADYSIISTHFMSKKYIKNFFPPKGTIKVETINGRPVAALVKRDKLDSDGVKLLQANKYEEGMSKLDSAYKLNPDNFGLWFWMGYGYFYTKKYEKSIEFFNKAAELDLTEEQIVISKMFTGVSEYELEKYSEAVKDLKLAEQLCKDENQKYYIQAHIALSYFKDEKYKEAIPYFKAVLPKYPYFKGNIDYCNSKI